jgi:transposase
MPRQEYGEHYPARMSMGRAKSKQEPRVVELSIDDLLALDARAEAGQFERSDCDLVRLLIASHRELLDLLRNKEISLARLRKILFGASTEKTKDVLASEDANSDTEPPPDEQGEGADSTDSPDEEPPKPGRKGHGRNGAKNYPGAKKVSVSHETLQAGDHCPECGDGTVYDTRPGVLIRIVGQAPLQATVYELQKLRCNLCGKLFTAKAPDGIGSQKYDATTGSMVALLKYGSGLPFNRQQRLQGSLGIPLPAATQWDIVHAKAKLIVPAHQELIRRAAQGDVLHNDDTNNKVLEFMGKRAKKAALKEATVEEEAPENSTDKGTNKKKKKRTGLFTTGIVSLCAAHQIAVFFTGRRHCGENLGDVLRQRAQELEPPIQMCDALARNVPAELQTILANCLAHGRRKFVDVFGHFRDQCRYVLQALEVIYKNDAVARKQQLSPEARLLFHQTHSRSTMDELHKWLNRQFDERRVEPNSGLGQAISYMLNHWEKLTLFLHKAGAPLDNNICERALKKIILHRKNSYFFKTQNGADVADLYMSLIYTCELNGVNPFDYLNELERHANELASHPEQWMPWNYRTTLAELVPIPAPGADVVDSSAAAPAADAVGAP